MMGSAFCPVCSKGRASSGRATLGRCVDCKPGRHQSKEEQRTCEACLPGTVAKDPGKSACEACLPGQFQGADGMTSCVECAAGRFSQASGGISCSECEAGQYSVDGASACSDAKENSTLPVFQREDLRLSRGAHGDEPYSKNASLLVIRWIVFPSYDARFLGSAAATNEAIIETSSQPDFRKDLKTNATRLGDGTFQVIASAPLCDATLYVRLALREAGTSSARGPWLQLLDPWNMTGTCSGLSTSMIPATTISQMVMRALP